MNTKPLQVYIDELEMERLDAWARERGWTKSQAVRAAIRALTRSSNQDPLLKASGFIEGLPADLSTHIDEFLGETYVAEKPRSKYRKRSPRR